MEKFRRLRQQIKNRLRYERRNYVKEMSNEIYRTSKRFWSFFSFKCKKKPIPDKVTYNGFSFSDDRGRAEAFDGFLNSIYFYILNFKKKQMFLLFLKKGKESLSKIIAPCRYFQ